LKLLLDTHLLLWAAEEDERLPDAAILLINDTQNQLLFSVASIWEVVIKRGKGQDDFRVEPPVFRRNLLDNGYLELPINIEHVFQLASLPSIHQDPFDRILIAQATVEGIILLTSDRQVARYPGPIQQV
jgi:PIN domain nuclease of toxin-antitoxin system